MLKAKITENDKVFRTAIQSFRKNLYDDKSENNDFKKQYSLEVKMKFRMFLIITIAAFLFINSPVLSQNADSNFTVQGRWTIGNCNSVFVKENNAFVASGRGVRIMDITNPDFPMQVAQINLDGSVSNIFVQNNLLFITTDGANGLFVNENFTAGLTIVDISNINQPQVLSFFNTEDKQAFCVTVSGNYAYVGYLATLIVLDITDPNIPQRIKYIPLPNTPHSIYYKDNYLYVADQSGGVLIFDVSTPNATAQVGTIDLWAENVTVQDNLVFLTQQGDGLKIVDIQNINDPIVVASVKSTNEFDYGVFVDGNTVFVSGAGDSLNTSSSIMKIIDITQISSPTVLSTYITNNIGTNYLEIGKRIFKSGDFVYMATIHGFRTIDVTDLGSPILRNNYKTIDETRKVIVNGNYAYIASSIPVLSIIDVETSGRLKEISYLNLSRSEYSNFVDMSVSGDYAYVGQVSTTSSDSDGFSIVDISQAIAQKEMSYYHIKRIEKLIARDNYVYTYGDGDTLKVIDVSDPTFPFQVNEYYIGDWSNYPLYDMKADDNYLYLSVGNGFLILNRQNPTDLSLTGSFVTTNYNITPFGNFDLVNNYAYILSDTGMLILDVSNPVQPDSVSVCTILSGKNDISVCNNYAYVATDAGIKMIDISDKVSPLQVGSFSNSGNYRANSIKCYNDIIYTAFEGLIVLSNDFITDVKNEELFIPKNFTLSQNYPNPFNPTTTIKYSVPTVETGDIPSLQLKIYDILGREIATLVNEKQAAGNYSVRFNAANLSSGIYLYKLEAGNFRSVKKMIILK